jgi:hypothetical protein
MGLFEGQVAWVMGAGHKVVWLCSTHCELKSGTVIDVRSQPELREKIDRVLGE